MNDRVSSGALPQRADLVVEGLRAWYPGLDRPVVDGVTFRFEGGRIYAIMGFNGSGKTTLLRAIAGLSPLDRVEGSVRFLDTTGVKGLTRHRPVIDRPASPLVGVLAQHGGYSVSLSARQHACAVAAPAAVLRMGELCRTWGLDSSVLDAPLGELAQIDRSIALLALMVARGARVLLLDEPTAGTDAERDAPRFFDALRSWVAPDRVVIVVEHHPAVVRRVADDVVFMEGGRIPRATLVAVEGGARGRLVRDPAGDVLVAGDFDAVARQPQVRPYLSDAARAAASPAHPDRRPGDRAEPPGVQASPSQHSQGAGVRGEGAAAGTSRQSAPAGIEAPASEYGVLLDVGLEEAGYAHGVSAIRAMAWKLTTEHPVACLIGPNGTGKTTALRALCGRIGLRHARGCASWRFHPQAPAVDLLAVSPWELRRYGVFALLGEGGTFPTLSTLDAARVGVGRSSWASVEKALLALFERFAPVFESSRGLRGMSPLEWMRVPSEVFSGGQRRVAAFASVVAAAQCWLDQSQGRALLLLDEPSAGVQPAGAEAEYAILAGVLDRWQDRVAIVVAEQRLAPVERALGAVSLVGTTDARRGDG